MERTWKIDRWTLGSIEQFMLEKGILFFIFFKVDFKNRFQQIHLVIIGVMKRIFATRIGHTNMESWGTL